MNVEITMNTKDKCTKPYNIDAITKFTKYFISECHTEFTKLNNLFNLLCPALINAYLRDDKSDDKDIQSVIIVTGMEYPGASYTLKIVLAGFEKVLKKLKPNGIIAVLDQATQKVESPNTLIKYFRTAISEDTRGKRLDAMFYCGRDKMGVENLKRNVSGHLMAGTPLVIFTTEKQDKAVEFLYNGCPEKILLLKF